MSNRTARTPDRNGRPHPSGRPFLLAQAVLTGKDQVDSTSDS